MFRLPIMWENSARSCQSVQLDASSNISVFLRLCFSVRKCRNAKVNNEAISHPRRIVRPKKLFAFNKNNTALEYPSYARDLASCDFYLFSDIRRRCLKKAIFLSVDSVKIKMKTAAFVNLSPVTWDLTIKSMILRNVVERAYSHDTTLSLESCRLLSIKITKLVNYEEKGKPR